MATNHYVTTNYKRLIGAQYVAPAPQIPSQELHAFRIFRLFQTPSAVGDGLLWFLHASEGAAERSLETESEQIMSLGSVVASHHQAVTSVPHTSLSSLQVRLIPDYT